MSPYTGNEKYIFVSYAEADKDRALPIIENMQMMGFRVCYHEQTEEDFSFSIDKKLESSAVALMLISPNSVDSVNARKEINYVLENQKKFLLAFLDDINSKYGLGKQLSELPSLHRSQYASEVGLLNEILKSPILKACRNLETENHVSVKVKSAEIPMEKRKFQPPCKIGDIVKFGTYRQNGTSKEDIEWQVLAVKDGKALVISKYALDCKRYNETKENTTWETCTLRKWLNNDFLNTAFSANEKAQIPTVTVSADKNPSHTTNPGKTTRDKIFLLSVSEANQYFAGNQARICQPTAFAKGNGVWCNTEGNCFWWLRTPGGTQDYAADIYSLGSIREKGDYVSSCNSAVRPALWIDLDGFTGSYESEMEKDSSKQIKSAKSLVEQKRLQKECRAGNTVKFGTYRQNGTSKEDIEWQVLAVKDGKALVISKYALDCKRYNETKENTMWETCTLRKWLNNDFLNTAFSADEKALIPTVTVSADKNPSHTTNPGKTTRDRIFLLSVPEANQYFAGNQARICQPTAFAKGNGVWCNTEGNCFWWLRTPGGTQDYAADIYSLGGIREKGDYVSSGNSAVRPALWIDLNT